MAVGSRVQAVVEDPTPTPVAYSTFTTPSVPMIPPAAVGAPALSAPSMSPAESTQGTTRVFIKRRFSGVFGLRLIPDRESALLGDYDTYRGFLIGATKDLQEFDPAYGLTVECTNRYVSFRLEPFFKPTKGTELALELGLNPPAEFQYRITNGRVVEREEHAISTSPTLGLNGRLFAFNVFKAGFSWAAGRFTSRSRSIISGW